MISVQLYYMVPALVSLELSMESHTDVEAVWRDLILNAMMLASVSVGVLQRNITERKNECVCVCDLLEQSPGCVLSSPTLSVSGWKDIQ